VCVPSSKSDLKSERICNLHTELDNLKVSKKKTNRDFHYFLFSLLIDNSCSYFHCAYLVRTHSRPVFRSQQIHVFARNLNFLIVNSHATTVNSGGLYV
jgi:hypothetical protein